MGSGWRGPRSKDVLMLDYDDNSGDSAESTEFKWAEVQ